MEQQGAPSRIDSLEGTIDVERAKAMHDWALRAKHGEGALVVDCTQVAHLGTAALQVLVALARDAGANGRRLRLVNVPDPVRRYVGLAGLATALELPEGDDR
jgi:anti-anti-sigma factor